MSMIGSAAPALQPCAAVPTGIAAFCGPAYSVAMIVRSRPHPLALVYTLRGSILPAIAPKLAAVAIIAVAAAWMGRAHRDMLPDLSAAPFGIVGVALSIVLGFRNNACYDRWWEARKQWGQLLVELRCFARDAVVLLPDDTALHARLVRGAIGFAHALQAHLRTGAPADAAQWLPPEARALILSSRNPPHAILLWLAREVVRCQRERGLSDILYTLFDARVTAMSSIATACERIRSTPTPFAYTLLVHRTTWLFCLLLPFGLAGSLGYFAPLVALIPAYAFFGLDALGDELEAPFATTANSLPLAAMVRAAEIDLLEMLGETRLPEPLQPDRALLL